MEIIRNDTRACGVNEDIDRDMKRLKGKIRVPDPTYVG